MSDENRELDATQESFSRAVHDPAAYIVRAQARAALRRTPAQFAVMALGFCVIGLISLLLGFVLHWLHWYPYRATAGTRTAAAEYLMYLPALFTSVAPGLLLANFVAHCIAPWRRVLDEEAARVPGTDYSSSQRGLAKAAIILAAVTLPFELLGVLLAR
jgi:hypothetical protein